MANITDPEAIKFCNEWIRPGSDSLAQNYYTAKSLVDEWNARAMGSKIPNTPDLIEDGSETDGRPPITGADATLIVVRSAEIMADYEANNSAKLFTVLKVAVNPKP